MRNVAEVVAGKTVRLVREFHHLALSKILPMYKYIPVRFFILTFYVNYFKTFDDLRHFMPHTVGFIR